MLLVNGHGLRCVVLVTTIILFFVLENSFTSGGQELPCCHCIDNKDLAQFTDTPYYVDCRTECHPGARQALYRCWLEVLLKHTGENLDEDEVVVFRGYWRINENVKELDYDVIDYYLCKPKPVPCNNWIYPPLDCYLCEPEKGEKCDQQSDSWRQCRTILNFHVSQRYVCHTVQYISREGTVKIRRGCGRIPPLPEGSLISYHSANNLESLSNKEVLAPPTCYDCSNQKIYCNGVTKQCAPGTSKYGKCARHQALYWCQISPTQRDSPTLPLGNNYVEMNCGCEDSVADYNKPVTIEEPAPNICRPRHVVFHFYDIRLCAEKPVVVIDKDEMGDQPPGESPAALICSATTLQKEPECYRIFLPIVALTMYLHTQMILLLT